MGFGVVLATLLCIATWMTSVHTSHGPMRNCCIVTTTTKVRPVLIKNYTIQQDDVCPISAIVFQTTRGKNICSDPKDPWAKRAKNKVDEEMKAVARKGQQVDTMTPAVAMASTEAKKGQNEEGSTSDTMTPAVAIASTEAQKGQNEEGSTSDTMTPAVAMALTEAEKGQNEEGSTSGTMTPAVSSSSTKAPMRRQRKKGRNGMRKGNRRGRKGQRKCLNP
ncbi:fractalkine-like [Scomber japonicus]|uniref:fractalkine-like n=1 Tax=Scomber japonicus TaxID=13676 RepID=UPI00230666A0|nr:fractalkine-like [Scomber japonicus]